MMTFAFVTPVTVVVVVAAIGRAAGDEGLICLAPLFALATSLFLERTTHFHAISFLADGVDDIGHVDGLASVLGSKAESR